jgi:hypothetical protein
LDVAFACLNPEIYPLDFEPTNQQHPTTILGLMFPHENGDVN